MEFFITPITFVLYPFSWNVVEPMELPTSVNWAFRGPATIARSQVSWANRSCMIADVSVYSWRILNGNCWWSPSQLWHSVWSRWVERRELSLITSLLIIIWLLFQIYGIFCTWHLVQLLKAAKRANNTAATLQRQASKRDKNIELMPFAHSAPSPPSTSSLGAISKNPIHDSLQMDLKRATAERASRRQMSQKSQMIHWGS